MPTNVGPGQTVDLAVNLTAPSQSGRFRSDWQLRNASNVLFGIGQNDNSIFYVVVDVTGYAVTGYDFIANACNDANWENEGADLPCPGSDGDERGFVRAVDSPKMEDGKSQGKGLLTVPENHRDGLISGKYEQIRIHSGDRFQALIGCQYKANDCDMVFRVQYQIGNGQIRTLGQWREVYEGQFYPVNIDLSSLDGERVKFILSVLANGSAHEDYALWINPRITTHSSQPPTATPTTGPATATATPTATQTPTTTQTVTETATQTATATLTSTATSTPTDTATPTPTATQTP
jgi:hypothetical protein